MAEFSAWGPEQGTRLAEQDIAANQKAALDAQFMLGRIAQQPAQQRMADAHARLYESQAGEHEYKVAAMQRLEREVRDLGDLPPDPLDALNDLVGASVRAGNPTEARLMLRAGGEIVQRLSTAARATAVADAENVKSVIRRNDYLRNALGAARSPEGWAELNNRYEQLFGEPSPYKAVPYSPEKASELEQQALTANQRLTLKLKEIEERGRSAGRDDRRTYQEGVLEYQRTRARAAAAREERIAKNGGGRALRPAAGDISAARAALKGEELDSEDLRNAAESIASRAAEIQAGNKAMGRDAAIQKAYNEAKENGELAEGPRFDLPIVGKVGTKKRFKRKGMAADSALEMPSSKDSLIRNRHYHLPQGIGVWNGTDFDLVDGEEDDGN